MQKDRKKTKKIESRGQGNMEIIEKLVKLSLKSLENIIIKNPVIYSTLHIKN